jgi:adenine-specific DNA-methyltransferase
MPRGGAKKKRSSTPIETIVHKDDHRANIPTAELETFMKSEDRQPKKVVLERTSELLYPRDPAADPQLVWRGKDEQDREPLEVSAPPIYIQEKVQPKAIIEALRADKRRETPGQVDLFSDFNGIKFEELVDFYKHEQNWSNRMVLGDSLEVMTSLAEKEGLKGQVQCLYIDPPYGVKFGSNWQVSTRKRDVKDGSVKDATRQPEQVKAFRDTWELGVHSYLTYLRDRLLAARELLTDSGSVFVQIGDENVHFVRALLDEAFGRTNFVSQIAFAKTTGFAGDYLSSVYDVLLWYAKDRKALKYRPLYRDKTAGDEGASKYRPVSTIAALKGSPFEETLLAASADLTSQGESADSEQEFQFNGRSWVPGPGLHWKTTVLGLQNLALADRIMVEGNSLRYVRFLEDFAVFPLSNVWLDIGGVQSRTDPKIFVVQTATEAVKRCILMATDPGDLVLDPTCGSGTTAYVAEQWGRRWITIDTSRVALTLARQRLMAARFPYYVLADEHGDLRRGFRYRTVPHITLRSIAKNPDIHQGMSREDMDRAVRKHAESEKLFDQPDADNAIVRVTGPFTVESLSPLLGPPDEDNPKSGYEFADDARNFETVILENLRAAGVQNTVKGQRLTFLSLQPWPGQFIHAVGEYSENNQPKRAAICIGPQYGTVDADLVRDAAKEAAGFFDILIICGFAFDAYIRNEFRQLGNLPILKASMNPDLSMGGDLLKKTGAGNLFTVFGEPDIDVRHEADDLVVEIRGLDVFDPTTGAIRSHTTDDIACWFIDTDYNAESFFIRHAYFTGGNDPYSALKRALKADIDEQAWASLYSTTSRPFPPPKSGKIAVKVINHYGDEVMKVYSIAEDTTSRSAVDS